MDGHLTHHDSCLHDCIDGLIAPKSLPRNYRYDSPFHFLGCDFWQRLCISRWCPTRLTTNPPPHATPDSSPRRSVLRRARGWISRGQPAPSGLRSGGPRSWRQRWDQSTGIHCCDWVPRWWCFVAARLQFIRARICNNTGQLLPDLRGTLPLQIKFLIHRCRCYQGHFGTRSSEYRAERCSLIPCQLYSLQF